MLQLAKDTYSSFHSFDLEAPFFVAHPSQIIMGCLKLKRRVMDSADRSPVPLMLYDER